MPLHRAPPRLQLDNLSPISRRQRPLASLPPLRGAVVRMEVSRLTSPEVAFHALQAASYGGHEKLYAEYNLH